MLGFTPNLQIVDIYQNIRKKEHSISTIHIRDNAQRTLNIIYVLSKFTLLNYFEH